MYTIINCCINIYIYIYCTFMNIFSLVDFQNSNELIIIFELQIYVESLHLKNNSEQIK